jgi:ABC-type polysaccharide/polyol phosphate export permease
MATSPGILRLPGMMFLRVLVERRSLIHQLVLRDFRQRFVGSAAGWLWTIIHPLVLLLSWVFVFQYCMRMPKPEGYGDNYTMFLFAGYLPWLLFSDTVQRSSMALLEQANLITKTVFPSEIIPVSLFLSSLVSHLIALGVVVVAIRIVESHFSILIAVLPLYMFFLGLFAIGLGWIFASLQVYLRDTAQVLVVALTGWFWLTPIFIDERMFPEGAQFLVRWNPMAHVVRGYRRALLEVAMPAWNELAIFAAVSVAVFVAGGLFFRHLKRGFADVL